MRGEARRALERGDAGAAADKLREALGLWRGEALADIAFEPSIQAEAARLEDLRLAALEDRIYVWVADSGDDAVARVDPGTNRSAESIAIEHEPHGLALAGGLVWVTLRGG